MNGQTLNRFLPHPPPTPWSIVYGASAPIVQTSDSGYLLNYSYGAANWDVAGPKYSEIVKTDSSFVPLWKKELTGINGKRTFTYNDGSSIIYSSGGGGVILEKINQNGQTIWLKKYARNYPNKIEINDAILVNGNIKLAGTSMIVNGFGNWTVFSGLLMDIDTSGNIIHADSLVFSNGNSLINVINSDAQGNYYILAGSYITKINSNNTVAWSILFNNIPLSLSNVAVLNNGDLLLSGSSYNSTLGSSALFLTRLNSNGGMIWSKNLNYISSASGIWQTSNTNSIFLSGSYRAFYGDPLKEFILNIDENGNPIWMKSYQPGFAMSQAFQKKTNEWYFVSYKSAPSIFNTDSLGNSTCPFSSVTPTFDNFPLGTTAFSIVMYPITFSSVTTTSIPISNQPYIDDCINVASINNNEFINQTTIYPNPSNGVINVKSTSIINEVTISNILGEEVYHASPNSLDYSIQIEPGVYVVTLRSGQTVKKEKVLVFY